MFNPVDTEILNEEIKVWSDGTLKDLKDRNDSLNIKHYPYSPNQKPLKDSLKRGLKKRGGAITSISYSMPRSGVFVHKGVSRGHGKDNPRTKKEWFNPVEENLGNLGDIVANGQGNMIINALLIK